MTLDKVKPGSRTVVVNITPGLSLRRRLMEMGLIPGSEVDMLRTAPLGDPMEIMVRGYRLSLSRRDAAHICCTD